MALASAADFKAPPRSGNAKPSGKTETKTVRGKIASREEAANGAFQLIGFGCIITHQYADAGAINMHGAAVARELALLSEKNAGIARGLDYLTEAGPYAGLITALMPFTLQIMANHNLIRADMLAGAGVVPPEALAGEVRAQMTLQAREAVRAQKEAEARLAASLRQDMPETSPNGGSA